MEAIILAGGFGTRLRHVVKNLPKPMAPINGKPFLEYIINSSIEQGINKIVLAVGYKNECIINYFGNKYKNITIDYSIENTPLLTGGAIKKALNLTQEEQVFVINGDTYFNIDFNIMLKVHQKMNSETTVAIKEMQNFDRYGTIAVESNKIINFEEKKYCKVGFINGGVYCINRKCLDRICLETFSFEKDYLEKDYLNGQFYIYESKEYFIDIGVPADYLRAQRDIVSGDGNE